MYPSLTCSHRRITVRKRSRDADLLGQHKNKGVSEEAFAALKDEFPDFLASPNRLELMLEAGHPDLNRFLRKSGMLGLRIANDRTEPSQVEILDYSVPTEAEIEDARYLECGLHRTSRQGFVSNSIGLGIVRKYGAAPWKGKDFGHVPNLSHLICVRREIRDRLAGSGLTGLELLPFPVIDVKGKECESDGVYLIWSSITLPPLDMKLFDDKGHVWRSPEVVVSTPQKNMYLVNGHEVSPRLRYAVPLPDIDVALTTECFGTVEAYRKIVYSQKARRELEGCGMDLFKVPVIQD